tara:strand:- start:1431 stop:1697 length:267 start_codon:yes stop_codon:yes gene_type:complete
MYIKAKVVFEDEDESEDFFCPVCSFPLATGEDFLAYKNYNCCNECFLTFAESRKEDWKDGWRPNQTKIEEYIYLRKSMFLLDNSQEKI